MLRSIYPSVKSFISILFLLAGCICFVYALPPTPAKPLVKQVSITVAHRDTVDYNALYDSLSLDSLLLTRQAYEYALQGYRNLESAGAIQHSGILTIVDFSLPSDKKRLF